MKVVQFKDGSYGIRRRFWFKYEFLEFESYLKYGKKVWSPMKYDRDTEVSIVNWRDKERDLDIVVKVFKSAKNPKKPDIGRVI